MPTYKIPKLRGAKAAILRTAVMGDDELMDAVVIAYDKAAQEIQVGMHSGNTHRFSLRLDDGRRGQSSDARNLKLESISNDDGEVLWRADAFEELYDIQNWEFDTLEDLIETLTYFGYSVSMQPMLEQWVLNWLWDKFPDKAKRDVQLAAVNPTGDDEARLLTAATYLDMQQRLRIRESDGTKGVSPIPPTTAPKAASKPASTAAPTHTSQAYGTSRKSRGGKKPDNTTTIVIAAACLAGVYLVFT